MRIIGLWMLFAVSCSAAEPEAWIRLENPYGRRHLDTPYHWLGDAPLLLIIDVKPRHRTVMQMPMDYPRINQFPEWFTVEHNAKYRLGQDKEIGGEQLAQGFTIKCLPGKALHMEVERIKK